MKLIIENWRQYKEKVDSDHKFNIILENINNSNEESEVEAIIDTWLLEEERLLNEIDIGGAIKKGVEYINTKVNNFLVNLYFKATNIISNLFSSGMKMIKPALKVLKFISGKLGGFMRKHPFISRVATIFLVALVLLCAAAIMNQAMAGEVDDHNWAINLLKGILSDELTNIEQYSQYSKDLLSTETDPKIKVQIVNAINHLETMKGSVTDISDFENIQAEGGEKIAHALRFFREFANNPQDAGLDEKGVKAAMAIWQEVGETIEGVDYEHTSMKTGALSRDSETLAFNLADK